MTIDREALSVEVDEELARLERIEEAATNLFVAVWRGLASGTIPDRTNIDDAALKLRDALNPDTPHNPDWLPEPLAAERAQKRT